MLRTPHFAIAAPDPATPLSSRPRRAADAGRTVYELEQGGYAVLSAVVSEFKHASAGEDATVRGSGVVWALFTQWAVGGRVGSHLRCPM
jgi:hypothetical protein